MQASQRSQFRQLFEAAVDAVKGDFAVRTAVGQGGVTKPTKILSVGKAAVAMFDGLPVDWQTSVPTLLITKTAHIGDKTLGANVTGIEASHPVPDQASLDAGRKALDFVASTGSDDRLLMLVSGGASALVEHLNDGVTFADLTDLTNVALGEGAEIAEINRRRIGVSAIKGGKLLKNFKGAHVDVLAISDVEGDSIDVIGSGIGASPDSPAFQYNLQTVASNAVARSAAAASAVSGGFDVVTNKETLYADISDAAAMMAAEVAAGPAGLYIYGGEPTVVLPKNPGQGGRNQALALELAQHFSGRTDVCGLVAGTDGTDGPTDAAGGFFDGAAFTAKPGAADALQAADSGRYLEDLGALLVTGPTGTNVMDLALIHKSPS